MKVNNNLLLLQCILCLFLGGLGCLFPFLPLHMKQTGLTFSEACIISIVAPCVALLGPLIVGPLADTLAEKSSGNNKSNFGKYIRIMLSATLLLGALFYLLLLSVPVINRAQARMPNVSFTSDPSGAVVLQERCTEERKCYRWPTEKKGSLTLRNCTYTCDTPPTSRATNESNPEDFTTIYPGYDLNEATDPSDETVSTEYFEDTEDQEDHTEDEINSHKEKRQSAPLLLEPPHLCYNSTSKGVICEVFTHDTTNVTIEISLTNTVHNEDDEDDWCRYQLAGYFSGRISDDIAKTLIDSKNSCKPVIQCEVVNPYDAADSVMKQSQCIDVFGDPDTTFWYYLVIRSIADIFPTAALVLFDAAIIIATRETSTGRGDVGRQLVWGTLGFAITAPLVGLAAEYEQGTVYITPIITFAIFMIVAAVITLFASNIPLSPPEWWWHTKCGMLALPMSTIRHYRVETGALLFVLFLLGVFWGGVDSFLPWHLQDMSGSPFLIGLTITIAALPAIPFLLYAERIVDYCGHTNILISAFTCYIVRYSITAIITEPWLVLLSEVLEVFTLILMWVTAILYLRHLIPRRFTVTGQALPVIAHFCLGRCIGAVFSGYVHGFDETMNSLHNVSYYMALYAAVVALLYFIIYHFILRPRCTETVNGPVRPPPTIMQSMNGNGSYTPLRIYHNGRARKGQFRY